MAITATPAALAFEHPATCLRLRSISPNAYEYDDTTVHNDTPDIQIDLVDHYICFTSDTPQALRSISIASATIQTAPLTRRQSTSDGGE